MDPHGTAPWTLGYEPNALLLSEGSVIKSASCFPNYL